MTKFAIEALCSINGNSGVVSLLGKYRVDQGLNQGIEKPINPDECERLDVLTKCFFKGPLPTIYVSIIQNFSTNELYISYPGAPNKKLVNSRALIPEAVNEILSKLLPVLQDPSVENKYLLFREMYLKGNDHVMQRLLDKKWEEEKKFRCKKENNYKHIKLVVEKLELFLYQNNPTLLDSFVKSEQGIMKTFFADFIDELFPNISILTKINLDNIRVMEYTTGNTDKHWAVHVEAKGIYYATKEIPNAVPGEFRVGLAKRDDTLPGCCAGCSSEFDALKHYNYTIMRSRDFPENFPPQNYVASSNVSEDHGIFAKFIESLHSKIEPLRASCPDIASHEFFKLFDPRENLGSNPEEVE